MKCENCPHFKVVARLTDEELGVAECDKYDLRHYFGRWEDIGKMVCVRPEKKRKEEDEDW